MRKMAYFGFGFSDGGSQSDDSVIPNVQKQIVRDDSDSDNDEEAPGQGETSV
jgi:hypothetical protein